MRGWQGDGYLLVCLRNVFRGCTLGFSSKVQWDLKNGEVGGLAHYLVKLGTAWDDESAYLASIRTQITPSNFSSLVLVAWSHNRALSPRERHITWFYCASAKSKDSILATLSKSPFQPFPSRDYSKSHRAWRDTERSAKNWHPKTRQLWFQFRPRRLMKTSGARQLASLG